MAMGELCNSMSRLTPLACFFHDGSQGCHEQIKIFIGWEISVTHRRVMNNILILAISIFFYYHYYYYYQWWHYFKKKETGKKEEKKKGRKESQRIESKGKWKPSKGYNNPRK